MDSNSFYYLCDCNDSLFFSNVYTVMKIIITILASILSGIFGRMGGAEDYDTLYRDIICSLISIGLFCLWFGFKMEYWYLYVLSFGLHWLGFSTYYEQFFGYHNMYIAGLLEGLALLPLAFTNKLIEWVIVRAMILAPVWGLVEEYIPTKILTWKDGTVIKEFLRYFSVGIVYLRRIK